MMKRIHRLLALVLLLSAVPLGAGDLKEVQTSWRSLTPRDHRTSFTEGTTVVPIPPETVAKVLVEELDHWAGVIPRLRYSHVIPKEKADAILVAGPISFPEVIKIVGNENRPLEQRLYPVGPHRTVNYLLQYIDYPWPVKNKWLLFREEDELDPARRTFHRHYQMIAGQLTKVEGDWRAAPDPDHPNGSLVSYGFVADAGFQVPYFIGRRICEGQVRVVLQALQNKADQLATGISQ